jgi:hypothetical protein
MMQIIRVRGDHIIHQLRAPREAVVSLIDRLKLIMAGLKVRRKVIQDRGDRPDIPITEVKVLRETKENAKGGV